MKFIILSVDFITLWNTYYIIEYFA